MPKAGPRHSGKAGPGCPFICPAQVGAAGHGAMRRSRRTSALDPPPSWLSCFSDLTRRWLSVGCGWVASSCSVCCVAVASVAVGRAAAGAAAAAVTEPARAAGAAGAASTFLAGRLRPLGLAGAPSMAGSEGRALKRRLRGYGRLWQVVGAGLCPILSLGGAQQARACRAPLPGLGWGAWAAASRDQESQADAGSCVRDAGVLHSAVLGMSARRLHAACRRIDKVKPLRTLDWRCNLQNMPQMPPIGNHSGPGSREVYIAVRCCREPPWRNRPSCEVGCHEKTREVPLP